MTTPDAHAAPPAELLVRLSRERGDDERRLAWGELVEWLREHELPRMTALLRRRCGRDVDLDAALHELLVGFYDQPPSDPRRLRLAFRARDAATRARTRESASSGLDPLDTVREDLAGQEGLAADPEAAALARDGARRARAMVAALPSPRHRRVAELRYLKGESLARIAERLRVPIGTVKSDLNREILPRLRRMACEARWGTLRSPGEDGAL